MKTRVEEIDKALQALYAEKELLESEMQAKDSRRVIDSLLRCEFVIDPSLDIQVYTSDKDKDVFLKLESASGSSFFVFYVSLTAQIKLRADAGRYYLQFDPVQTDNERFKQECDKHFQFKQIVAFLKENGIEKSQFNYAPLTRNIKRLEEQVTKAKNNLQFVQENI